MTKEEKLARLYNRATRYELIAECGAERLLIGYTSRTGRHGLLRMANHVGPQIVSRLQLSDAAAMTFDGRAADGARIGEWRLHFSGRTQRQAIIEGELPWVGETVA